MRVLVISTHPDDETLGCGGTLLKHAAAGDDLYWVIATKTYEPVWSSDISQRKAAEIAQVARSYGMRQHFELGFPSVRLDTIPQVEIIDRTREVLSTTNPELVYVVFSGDIHTDHHAVYAATMSALKPFLMARLGVRRILCYEVLSSTEAAPPRLDRAFMPNVFSDITPWIQSKMEIMRLYETEVQPDPLPRGPSAIRALARYRGATIGVEYAEAFMLMREFM